MQAFDPDRHQALAALWKKRIFFVAGSIKSGTSWVQMLLNAHPDIACGGEAHYVDRLAVDLTECLDKYNQYVLWKNGHVIDRDSAALTYDFEQISYLLKCLIGLSMLKFAGGREVACIGEKTPDNIRALAYLDQLFPGVRIIHVLRDGRDCAVSGWFHNLRSTPDWQRDTHASFADYVGIFAREWAEDIRTGRNFAKDHPDRYLEIRYESLLVDPLGQAAALFRFLGVADAPDIVAACCRDSRFQSLSGGRRSGEEDRASFFRKGISGDWRNHFTDAMNEAFLVEAGNELALLGYDRAADRLPVRKIVKAP